MVKEYYQNNIKLFEDTIENFEGIKKKNCKTIFGLLIILIVMVRYYY